MVLTFYFAFTRWPLCHGSHNNHKKGLTSEAGKVLILV